MSANAAPYVGRFAPSPTGPLHFGSLLAAAGSYLRARQAGGRWLLRIEDIDPPREVAGASDSILRCLELYGFEWDGDVTYQSAQPERYRDALRQLGNLVYRCTCSRADIVRDGKRLGVPAGIYPGTCRNQLRDPRLPGTWRVRFPLCPAFDDLLQGHIEAGFAGDDFVVWRRQDWPAYQLAVALDDGAQGITEVVRGVDLLDSTPRQIYLLRQLGFRPPAYMHLPVCVAADGEKLSKQTGARALDTAHPGTVLWHALAALRATPPTGLAAQPVAEIWRWAIRHWSPNALKNIKTVFMPAAVN